MIYFEYLEVLMILRLYLVSAVFAILVSGGALLLPSQSAYALGVILVDVGVRGR